MAAAIALAMALAACAPDAGDRSAKEQPAPPPAPAPPALTVVGRTELPAMRLRGYGQLAGDFALLQTPAGGQCSRLVITCDDAAKAAIVHAKYLSDLHALLPVTDCVRSIAGTALPVVEVPDQGVIAAFRSGRQVAIAAAGDHDALAAVIGERPELLAGAELAPSATVPMFLDAWDKHGFRFYYRPGETPPAKPGGKRVAWKDYDVLGEFDFARRNGRCGFVFWQNEDQCDAAEGLDNNRAWEFGARACANRSLPMVINTSAGNPTWLLNRFRGQTQWKMPGYCGGYYCPGDSFHAGNRQLAWSADTALDASLATLQRTWREFSKRPNTIEYLEPHGELRHGDHDMLNEYGPQADRTFRAFLKEAYRDLPTLSRRWFGRDDALRSWDEVRVPEIAGFMGFGDEAIDLGGAWKVRLEDFRDGKAAPTTPAPEDWYLPSCDDGGWPAVTAPHSDLQLFQPRRPAVWRRSFAVPAEWKAKRGRVWLYVFSLNRGSKDPCPIYLNGSKVAAPALDRDLRPVVVEVSDALRSGGNLLAMRLPANFLGYRVYLSDRQPVQYPHLGEQMNARWADFVRWHARIRKDTLRRSFEAIREADPDRSVVCMSPDSFITQVEELCQDYGGHFHNTGYMGGWWAEPLPMMMRAAGLPFSAEPGNPAHNLAQFKTGIGNWLTEGVNAIHYFIHVGDVYWHDEIRPWFEANQAIIGAFGKMHVPRAEVAMLYGDDVNNLVGWPWGGERSGYVPTQFNVALHKEYHMDGVSIQDFARGFAAGYRVIIDTGTCIMDERTVDGIEGWIAEGGVFVAVGECGRHTPERADSWPISRLTGYRTERIRQHPDGQDMRFAPGQEVFQPAAWEAKDLRGTGQELSPTASGCIPLALWPNGTTAIGMRRIGKGAIIDVGCNYQKPQLLRQILAWRQLARIPGASSQVKVVSTHEISNNGLYDIWITWNTLTQDNRSDLVFRDGARPPYCIDLTTRERLVPSAMASGAATIAGMAYGPLDIRILAAPRQRIASAPLDWLVLQRGWWRGTKPPGRTLPAREVRDTLDLGEGWLMRTLADGDGADHAAMAAPAYDDRGWASSRLGTWLVPEDLPTHRLFFRRRFTVPARWDGEIELWLHSWQMDPVFGKARVWLDGGEVLTAGSPQRLTAQLRPGSDHLLAVELAGDGRQVIGFRGNLWLAHLPKPASVIPLAGTWAASADGLVWNGEAELPGPLGKASMVKRSVVIDRALAGQTIMLLVEAPGIGDVIVNGSYARRHHHLIGERTYLNITPWIRFGEENTVVIPCARADAKIGIRTVELRCLPPDASP